MISIHTPQFLRCGSQSLLQRLGLLLDLLRRVRVRCGIVARVADVQYLFCYPVFISSAVKNLRGKFNVCFNFGFVGVWVRCCSLNTVVCISRGSCPSLGLSEDRGAEIARRD